MSAVDEVQRRLAESLRHPVSIALFSLLVMVGGGWVGDLIKGDCLGLAGLHSCSSQTLDWPGLLASFILFAVGAWGLVAATRSYLPIRQLRAQVLGRGRTAVVASVSTLTNGIAIAEDGSRVTKEGGETVTISGNIRRDIEALEPLKCNTQQFLRALAPHIEAGALHIVLLGSHGELGSARLRARYAALLRHYLPKAEIDIESVPLNMENLDAMKNLIIEICDSFIGRGIAEREIMIDVTAGHKTASIAAALATLHRPNLQFQYVRTEPPFDIVAFDVISETPSRLN
jgi:hypothetical protein